LYVARVFLRWGGALAAQHDRRLLVRQYAITFHEFHARFYFLHICESVSSTRRVDLQRGVPLSVITSEARDLAG
jgi:hypothetical protein